MYGGGENEGYVEVWKLVFSELNDNKDDSQRALANKKIDRGMGVEGMG